MACAFASVAMSGCVPDHYAGVDLRPRGASAEVQALAQEARAGDKRAQFALGQRFERGDGVPRDLSRAGTLYRAAATDSGGTRMMIVPRPRGAVLAVPVSTGAAVPGLPEARAKLAVPLSQVAERIDPDRTPPTEIKPHVMRRRDVAKDAADKRATDDRARQDADAFSSSFRVRPTWIAGMLMPHPDADVERKVCQDIIPAYEVYYRSAVTHCYTYQYLEASGSHGRVLFLLDIALTPEREQELTQIEHNPDDTSVFFKVLQMQFAPEAHKTLCGRFKIETLKVGKTTKYHFIIKPAASVYRDPVSC